MQNSIFVLATYLSIVSCLIEEYSFSSIVKVEFTAIMIGHYLETGTFSQSKSNPLKCFFKGFASVMYLRMNEIKAINEAFNILQSQGFIDLSGDIIHKNKTLPNYKDVFFNSHVDKLMNDINQISIEAFLKELINYA